MFRLFCRILVARSTTNPIPGSSSWWGRGTL
jgi:hypothetical protein